MYEKAFSFAKNPKYDGCQRRLASIVYKCFDKKTCCGATENENMSNEELVEEFHKTIIRKFKKRKVHSSFIDNIWGTGLADMQLISKLDKGIRFLLCVIDIFSKYIWVICLKDKRGITITNAFQKILDTSICKPNKDNECYNRSMKSFLRNNNTEMYSTHNEGKSVVTAKFIRTLRNKIYKYVDSISINVYIDK